MLTPRQKTMLDAIVAHQAAHGGSSPSYDELAAAIGLRSKSSVLRMLDCIEERGFILRMPHRARAIEVLKRPDGQTVDRWARFSDAELMDLYRVLGQDVVERTGDLFFQVKAAAKARGALL